MDDARRRALLQSAREQAGRQAQALVGLPGQLGEDFTDLVERVLAVAGKVVTTGSGTSGLVAERLAHLLSVCGTPAFALGVNDALHGGAGAVTPGDLVIAFSKGGRSAELTDLLDLLHSRGAHVVAVTENPDSPFARAADTVVRLRTAPAEADLDGLVATGSTLVHSAWGDALTHALREARGHSAADVVAVHPAGIVGTHGVRP